MSADVEALARVLADTRPSDSNYVQEWPEDEQEMHRRSGYGSFTERAEAVQALREQKQADAILSALPEMLRADTPEGAALRGRCGLVLHVTEGGYDAYGWMPQSLTYADERTHQRTALVDTKPRTEPKP